MATALLLLIVLVSVVATTCYHYVISIIIMIITITSCAISIGYTIITATYGDVAHDVVLGAAQGCEEFSILVLVVVVVLLVQV